ncbi:hypothetical protein HZS_3575, partial [Henneguya salminicola]
MNNLNFVIILTNLVKFCSSMPDANEIGLSLRTNLGCKKSEIAHSEVIIGRSLIPQIEKGNRTKLLGIVESIQDCIALCCTLHECNMVSFKNGTCLGVHCHDPIICSINKATQLDEGAQLSLVIHRSEISPNP